MHLGVIPDGNRRYARDNNLGKKEAYRAALENIIENFREFDLEDTDFDIEEVSFYLLSEENLERDSSELEALFDLLKENIKHIAKEFNKKGFQFNWVSTRPNALPEDVREKLEAAEEKFDTGEKKVNALISYSGKRDIVKAAEHIQGNGGVFTTDHLRKNLGIDTAIDFVIRTGDNPYRECLSGFPIWNASYAEFYHIEKNFPAVDRDDVGDAFDHFKKLRRKKGK